MSNSLQDQLLALGLAKEKPRNPPGQKNRPGNNRHSGKAGKPHAGKSAAARSSKPRSGRSPQPIKPENISPENISPENISPEDITLAQAYRIREQEEKSARQRARELKMEEDRKRAEVNRKIRNIIEAGRLNLADASEARYFMYKDRIRKVWASAEQLAGLNDGSLGVVYLAGGYHILDAENTEAVRRISAEHVADLLSGSSDDDELWAAGQEGLDQSAEPVEELDDAPPAGLEKEPGNLENDQADNHS
jgi:uncharacterized protein YaiL (DUF2058 family)